MIHYNYKQLYTFNNIENDNNNMIASVQYNDLRGTAAADVSDFHQNSLQQYLETTYKTYDATLYYCVGCTMWISEEDVDIKFICYNRSEDKYVRFSPDENFSHQEAFSLFKRFEVVIGIDVNEITINGEDDNLKLE